MDIQDINNIIAEISNLKNQGIVLSENLDCERIMSDYKSIEDQSRKGRYILPKMYALVKRIQKYINDSLYNNDVNVFIPLFSTVKTIRQKLGQQYQIRAEIVYKIRDIKRILNEEKPVERAS